MGRHELLVYILWYVKWAGASGWMRLCSPCSRLTQAHRQEAVHLHGGPLRAFRSAAIPLSANYVGPHNSLASQPVVCLMGQRDPIVGILQRMALAHASALLGIAFYLVWANSIPMDKGIEAIDSSTVFLLQY